jgi:hypothetical protein
MIVHDRNLADAAIRRCDTTSRLMSTADKTPPASCRPGHLSGDGSYSTCIDLVIRTDERYGTHGRQAELLDRVVRDTLPVQGDKDFSPGDMADRPTWRTDESRYVAVLLGPLRYRNGEALGTGGRVWTSRRGSR